MNDALVEWASQKKKRYNAGVFVAVGLIIFSLLSRLIFRSGTNRLQFATLFLGGISILYLLLTCLGWISTLSKRKQERLRRQGGAPPSYRTHITVTAAAALGLKVPDIYQKSKTNVLYGGPRGQLTMTSDKLSWHPNEQSQKSGVSWTIDVQYSNVLSWKYIKLHTATPVACIAFITSNDKLIDFTIFDPQDLHTQLTSHLHTPES